ncbi:hypothetical protein BURCENBC7_AP3824 [Burkholderia cenocepacia BC7]|nr:hypothetical protein BURCENK562V_C5607 [Burkholderia cenocepacia K56-2Valvano]ERI32098.1 hypothetical protein BURCENBC7_AP3824 [Burkholderia cenocepacia BC7]
MDGRPARVTGRFGRAAARPEADRPAAAHASADALRGGAPHQNR